MIVTPQVPPMIRIGGRLSIGLFPGFHVTVPDVALFGDSHESIGSVQKARVWIELLPLLHKQVRLRRVDSLRSPLH